MLAAPGSRGEELPVELWAWAGEGGKGWMGLKGEPEELQEVAQQHSPICAHSFRGCKVCQELPHPSCPSTPVLPTQGLA